MRIYSNKCNINDGSIIVTIESATALSSSVDWGDGTLTYGNSLSAFNHTYNSIGEYKVNVTSISTSLDLPYLINYGDFVLSDSENIRLIEEKLELPYPELKIPSNDVVDADIINTISNNLYTNWKYLKSSGIIVDPLLPTQSKAWYGTLNGFTGWHGYDENSSSNTLVADYVDLVLSGNYLIIATKNNISINKNNINLNEVFMISEYEDNASFEDINSIALDSKGRLFVSDKNFIYKFNIDIFNEQAYCLNRFPVSNIRKKYHKNITSIHFNSNDELVVVDSEYADLTVYDKNSNIKIRTSDGLSGLVPITAFSKENYTFVLTQDKKLIKYDSQYFSQSVISLSSDISSSETIVRVKSNTLDNIVFIVTNNNLYKYLYENNTITLITGLTDFNRESLNDDSFVSLAYDSDYNLFLLENNQINAFDCRNTTTSQINTQTFPWEAKDLMLRKDSYIKDESYNVILKRLFDLNYILLKSISIRVIKQLYPGNITDKFYAFINYQYDGELDTTNLYVNHNEKVSHGVLQRTFGKIFEIQEFILSIINMETDAVILSKVRSLILKDLYPVGEIYQTLREGDPSSWLGFGVWTRYSGGRVLVGYDAANSNFNTIGLTGGEATHILIENELPSHTHTIQTASIPDHYHGIAINSELGGSSPYILQRNWNIGELSNSGITTAVEGYAHSGSINVSSLTATKYGIHATTNSISATGTASPHTHTAENTGLNVAHNNLQPYTTIYIWKRTA